MNRTLFTTSTALLICAVFIVSAVGDTADSTLGPYPIRGLDDYGLVVTGSSENGQVHYRLINYLRNAATTEYSVVDSFSSIVNVQLCDPITACYVAREDSCFHLVTMKPSQSAEKDTVASSCMPGSTIWVMSDYFFRRSDSLFVYVLYVPSEDIVNNWRCVIGTVSSDRTLDTVALLTGITTCRLSPDGTEVFLCTFQSTGHDSKFRLGTGVYDLLADSLLMPLEGSFNTTGAYRLSRDLPLYFVRDHPDLGVNVWSWNMDRGEKQVTHFQSPDVVKRVSLTADSLICFVAEQGTATKEERVVSFSLEELSTDQ